MIHFVSGGRQFGKTTAMIRAAAETNAYIICPDRRQAQHVWDMAREMGVEIHFPMTWHEFQAGQFNGKDVKGFVIDNLDQCIQSMTHVPIHAASLPAVDRIQLEPENGETRG